MEDLFGSHLMRWREIPDEEMREYREALEARQANQEQADATKVGDETAGGFRVSPQQNESKANELKPNVTNTDI